MIAPKSIATTRRSRRLGESCQQTTLKGGLTLIHAPRPGFKRKFAMFASRYGSVDSSWTGPNGKQVRVPDGIAHFLEHQLFKKQDGDITDKFTANGASANAATSHTSTVYHFDGVSMFDENLRLLMRMCLTPWFDKALVDTERGIITQEIVSYRDNPFWVNYQAALEALYIKHPVRIDIAGTEATVAAVTPDMLAACHSRFYHPANCALFTSGDMDIADVVPVAQACMDEYFDGRRAEPLAHPVFDEPAKVSAPRVERAMHTTLPRIIVAYKRVGMPMGGEALARADAVTDLMLDLLFGRSTAFYEQLYREGLVSGDFGASQHCEQGFAYIVIGGETSNPDELEKRINTRLDQARKHGLSAGDVERKQRMIEGRVIRTFEDPEATAEAHKAGWLLGYDPFDALEMIESITIEDVRACLASAFDPACRTVSLLRKPERGTSARRKG